MIWQGRGDLRANGAIHALPVPVDAFRGDSLRRKSQKANFQFSAGARRQGKLFTAPDFAPTADVNSDLSPAWRG